MNFQSDLDPRGIKWMGVIPGKWTIQAVKRHYDIQLGKMLQNDSMSDNDSLVPYAKALHVLWGQVSTNDLPEMWASPSEIEQYGIIDGDLLVCEGGEAGRAGVVKSPPNRCIIQNALHRLRPKNSADLRFLQYVLHAVSSAGWFEVLCNKATISHFTREKFADLRIPVPSADEQGTIAAFLDQETERIDTLIAKKERQIELLQEKRAALISHVVTKGLNPNVKMKDSGIEWLGRIPENWEVTKLKRITSIRGRIGFRGYTVDDLVAPGEGALTIGGKHIDKRNELDLSDPEYLSWDKFYESPEISLKKGDIIFVQRGSLGKTTVIRNEIGPATINPSIILLTQINADVEYFFYVLTSIGIQSQVSKVSSATAVPMISQELLGSFTVTIPSLPEQRDIAILLRRETKKMDTLVEKVQESITTLREYRTALISAAVTGKIDARKEVS